MLLAGTKPATIAQAQIVDIHGTRFTDVWLIFDDAPDQAQRARFDQTNAPADLQAGERIEVSFLMNMPISIARPSAQEK